MMYEIMRRDRPRPPRGSAATRGGGLCRVRKVAHFYIISSCEILFREIYDYKQ